MATSNQHPQITRDEIREAIAKALEERDGDYTLALINWDEEALASTPSPAEVATDAVIQLLESKSK